MLGLVGDDTILLGHGLESDLRSLKIIHVRVVDTAIVFPHRRGPPLKRALRNLMKDHLNKIIQDDVDGGHDSLEDARACMELMLWKTRGDLQKTTRRGAS
ncbi:RNA exonuclease 1 homolog [Geodia barretti]|uniref:RNA exonuclease 1 homolog n=1 Tax=Geodia barretti TaxID=519541 RepID=A0AA35TQ76_GEOBA|nr:RNA exonuclease 1 homolog [Geodia barretti]